MPRTPATEAQRDAARRHLQKAAAGLYAELGATGVSARAVAERANVSVGTIYSYFGSLQGLMQSLWMQPLEGINARFEQVAAAVPEPLPRLRALLEAYVDVARARPELYRGVFLFVRPAALPTPERGPLETAVFPSLLVAAIRDGQAQGAIREGDPVRLAQLAWAGVHGALALPVNFDRLQLDATGCLAGDMVGLVVDGLAS